MARAPLLGRRTALAGAGAAVLASPARGAAPAFTPLKSAVRLPLAALASPWSSVTFRARFTKSNGEDSLAPGIAVRTPSGLRAWCAYCPHELCVLKLEDSHRLRCPCHFSMFDPAAGGAWISGPAPRGAWRFAAHEEGGDLVVTAIEAEVERRLMR